jgi:hypothetical protein
MGPWKYLYARLLFVGEVDEGLPILAVADATQIGRTGVEVGRQPQRVEEGVEEGRLARLDFAQNQDHRLLGS